MKILAKSILKEENKCSTVPQSESGDLEVYNSGTDP
jgi:hypothetical protein